MASNRFSDLKKILWSNGLLSELKAGFRVTLGPLVPLLSKLTATVQLKLR